MGTSPASTINVPTALRSASSLCAGLEDQSKGKSGCTRLSQGNRLANCESWDTNPATTLGTLERLNTCLSKVNPNGTSWHILRVQGRRLNWRNWQQRILVWLCNFNLFPCAQEALFLSSNSEARASSSKAALVQMPWSTTCLSWSLA